MARSAFLLTTALATMLPTLGHAAPPSVDFVAYIPDVGSEVTEAEARDAINQYATFLKDRGVADATVKIMADLNDLEGYVQKRPPDRPAFGVIHPVLVSLMQKDWKMTPIAIPIQDGSELQTRVLVALRGSGAKSVADLKGKSLAITRPWNEMPEMLGLLLFGKPDRPDAFFSQLLLAETSTQAALAVLRRKADAALVNGYVYRTALREVRQVWQNLDRVAETPPLHLSPAVAFAGTPPDLVQQVTQAILGAKESDAGRELLRRFKIDGFKAITTSDLEGVEGKLLQSMLQPAAPAAQVKVERMGGDVGLTFQLPARLSEGEKAVMAYRVGDGAEARANLRCATLACTGVLPAATGKNVTATVIAVGSDGSERRLGSYQFVAP